MEAMARDEQRDLHEGRSNITAFLEFFDLLPVVRGRIATVLGCDAEEIALTHHTTEGVNFAVLGMTWHAGDEVITTNLEHIGGLAPLYLLEHRFGVRVRVVDCGETGERALEAIAEALSARTRAVVLSHVSYSTGSVLPVKEITRRAHTVGALVIVDGAQSAGAIPVDVRDLGVDAYAIPGQKWLCGPEGTGALYVARSASGQIAPTIAGGFSFESFDELGAYALHTDARRFETGGVFRAGIAGLNESLRWITEEVTLEWAYARIAALAEYCRRALEGLEGVDLITPAGRQAGLVNFTFPGWEPMAVMEEMADREIVIRGVDRPAGLRVSTGFYNTEQEVDRLVAALREVQRLEPHPPRVTFHLGTAHDEEEEPDGRR